MSPTLTITPLFVNVQFPPPAAPTGSVAIAVDASMIKIIIVFVLIVFILYHPTGTP
ncbi:MAG TPA: hypothetical protein VM370_01300 [Candidatus Thermoplasmatota archaeon]|nr:hypothetical protein [Candidatus Thermoplasmatota archaeon]